MPVKLKLDKSQGHYHRKARKAADSGDLEAYALACLGSAVSTSEDNIIEDERNLTSLLTAMLKNKTAVEVKEMELANRLQLQKPVEEGNSKEKEELLEWLKPTEKSL